MIGVLVLCLSVGLGASFSVPEELMMRSSKQQFILHQDSIISMIPVQGAQHHETTTPAGDTSRYRGTTQGVDSADRRQQARRGDGFRGTTPDHDLVDRRQQARRGDGHRETTPDHDSADRRQQARRGDGHRETTPDHDSADRRQQTRRGDRHDPLLLTTHGDHDAKVTPVPPQPIHPFGSLPLEIEL